MLQINDSVGSFMNGSISAVSASGTNSMSLAWMGIQPRIEDPSNATASANTASVSSGMGMVKWCHGPRKSMNFRSTMTACLSFASPVTSFPFGIYLLLVGLQRRLAALAGTDADHFFDVGDEDLAVADASSLGGTFDGLQRPRDHLVREHDFHLHLGQEVDDVLGAAVQLGVAFLTAEALHFRDGQAQDAHVGQRFLHLVELEGLDDGLDLLHRTGSLIRKGRNLLAGARLRNGPLLTDFAPAALAVKCAPWATPKSGWTCSRGCASSFLGAR